MPLHPKAKELFKSGLFSGLPGFDELEKRIAAIDDPKTKGDAFEVFAEAYFVTQRKHDAAKVWPLSAVPLEVLRQVALPEKDNGVDGIYLTLLGHHNAYQVKFRSGRKPLTWEELSTFIGLADSRHIHSRVLFTNCEEFAAVLDDRHGFFCIRGTDLDRLEPEDFKVIESWLAESVFEIPKYQPKKHQLKALAALVPALKTEARVSAIMACGTGKTLVALWVAEQLEASRILVLLPSLSLLRQTMHEWLRQTNLPGLAYLCVCSDKSVKEGIEDALDTKQSDLDFEVSTEPSTVRQFLDAPFSGVKVIFSTYQSAAVVGQALFPGEMFDLGIFDEAHKTAGREGRNYGFALDDANLPIRKRLFVTATPRHYNPHQRNRESEAHLVYSMDNQAVYGRQDYCLTFGEAARLKIICRYKVIISVITSDMVSNELLSRSDVLINGDLVRARQVANQIALRDAVEKYGVSKIFTFHKTVKSADSFIASGNEGIWTQLPNFGRFHINGTMPTARRERLMKEFRAASRAVMSNARCLTEGVDVPAVDMVAFLSPKRSRVDIVQATGRAMRCSPGKALGYVLMPLYVELAAGENVEDAVRRANFDEVWDILQSLQEQDEALAEVIRDLGEQKTRGKGFDDRGFADLVEFNGPQLTMENLRSAIITRCVENLYASWDAWFGKLKIFHEQRGDCNVPQTWKDDLGLGPWVSNQRVQRKRGVLSEDRIRRLNELDFEWDHQKVKKQETWMNWYRELEKYTQENGNPHIPKSHANRKLASWVWTQRQRRKGTNTVNIKQGDVMSQEQRDRLDKLGFRWDAHQEKWLENFEKLKSYKTTYGHCDVGINEADDKILANWVRAQRANQTKGEFPVDRKARLDSIGINTHSELPDLRWLEMYDRLKQYHAHYGDAKVPQVWNEDPKLGRWAYSQRVCRRNGQLTPDKIKMLDALGFVWSKKNAVETQ